MKLRKSIIAEIIDGYTLESGVRNLERQIASVCRKVVTKIALEEPYNICVTHEDIISYLGKKRFTRDTWETNKYIGVVTGLAWTQVGERYFLLKHPYLLQRTLLSPLRETWETL